MKKQLRNIYIKIIICILQFVPFLTMGQAVEKPYREPQGLNNWYVELAGSGLFYSLNYEKVLTKSTQWGWVGRVGLGYNPADYTLLNKVTLEKNTFMFPFTSSVLYGERKEKLEFGLGFTLLATGINNREVVPTGVFGFRVVETNKVCFRVTYTPMIRDGQYISWFGVSLGKNFDFK